MFRYCEEILNVQTEWEGILADRYVCVPLDFATDVLLIRLYVVIMGGDHRTYNKSEKLVADAFVPLQ
jgi:hypothetical protein